VGRRLELSKRRSLHPRWEYARARGVRIIATMSRPSVRHLVALGLLAPWLVIGCGSSDSDSDAKSDAGDTTTE
jgi:hypothetical protein